MFSNPCNNAVWTEHPMAPYENPSFFHHFRVLNEFFGPTKCQLDFRKYNYKSTILQTTKILRIYWKFYWIKICWPCILSSGFAGELRNGSLAWNMLIASSPSSVTCRSNRRRSSIKQVFLKISQNSQESTCARVSFFIKLQAWGLQLY